LGNRHRALTSLQEVRAVRKLIVTEFVSLDGVMEAPGGEPGYAHSGWVGELFNDELGAYKLEEQLAADVLLLGRRTYESFYGAWPAREGPMADKINEMEKAVVSNTLTASPWTNTTILAGDLHAAIAELKAGSGGSILVPGSRTLAQWLLTNGLLDELHLQVFPLILGSGQRFFPESPTKRTFTLVGSVAFPGGIQAHTYRPA
jgi:dihydrofolate reductase